MRKQTVEDRRDALLCLGEALMQIAEQIKRLESIHPNNDRHIAIKMLQATIREVRGPQSLSGTFSRIVYSSLKEQTKWAEVPLVESDF